MHSLAIEEDLQSLEHSEGQNIGWLSSQWSQSGSFNQHLMGAPKPMAPWDISCNFSIKIWLSNCMASSTFVPNIKHEASANRTWSALCRRASSISQPRNKQSAAPARNTTLHEAFAQTVLGHPTISIPYRATFQITRDTVLHAPCNLPLIQSKVNKVSMRYELRSRHRKLSNLPTETSNIRTDWCFI